MHPSLPETLWVSVSEVLTKVKSQTVISHIFVVSEKYFHCTKQKLKQDRQCTFVLRCVRATIAAVEKQ